MGRLDVIIPDDIERELRIRVAQVFGGERGALSRAVCEAIELWLKQREPSGKKR